MEQGTVRLVCISDTHTSHQDVVLPEGDVLIHAGDFTLYGKRQTVTRKGRPTPQPGLPPNEWPRGPDQVQGGADDFNTWLGEQQQFSHRVVVLGNHEKNQDWTAQAADVVSNATLLVNEGINVSVNGVDVNIWGCDFYWPHDTDDAQRVMHKLVHAGSSADVVIAHGPAGGHVDGDDGCLALAEVLQSGQLPCASVLVSGHVHHAHGVERANVASGGAEVVYVNAACAGSKTDIVHPPVVLTLSRGDDGRICVSVE